MFSGFMSLCQKRTGCIILGGVSGYADGNREKEKRIAGVRLLGIAQCGKVS